MLITKNGYDKIKQELDKLITIDRPEISQYIEEIRPIGVIEDNPEYLQALENQSLIENKIDKLANILSESIIFDKTMCKNDTVSFGSSVSFVNCDNDDEKTYTIVSIYESDINKGLISLEAPFIQNMIGLHSGDIFEFNGIEYEITDINYSLIN